MVNGRTSQRDGCIAIIGRDRELRDVMCEVLELAGYRLTNLDFEGLVVDDLARLRPSMIVLDIGLDADGPGSGWGYLRELRAHQTLCAVPILVCSADLVALRERRRSFARDAKLAALDKPFGVDDLVHAVSTLVDGVKVPGWDDHRDLVLVADADANLVDASQAALTLLGLTNEGLRGRKVSEIVAHEVAWTEAAWQRYIADRRWRGEVLLRTAHGKQIPAIASAEIMDVDGREWHISRLTRADEPALPA